MISIRSNLDYYCDYNHELVYFDYSLISTINDILISHRSSTPSNNFDVIIKNINEKLHKERNSIINNNNNNSNNLNKNEINNIYSDEEHKQSDKSDFNGNREIVKMNSEIHIKQNQNYNFMNIKKIEVLNAIFNKEENIFNKNKSIKLEDQSFMSKNSFLDNQTKVILNNKFLEFVRSDTINLSKIERDKEEYEDKNIENLEDFPNNNYSPIGTLELISDRSKIDQSLTINSLLKRDDTLKLTKTKSINNMVEEIESIDYHPSNNRNTNNKLNINLIAKPADILSNKAICGNYKSEFKVSNNEKLLKKGKTLILNNHNKTPKKQKMHLLDQDEKEDKNIFNGSNNLINIVKLTNEMDYLKNKSNPIKTKSFYFNDFHINTNDHLESNNNLL